MKPLFGYAVSWLCRLVRPLPLSPIASQELALMAKRYGC